MTRFLLLITALLTLLGVKAQGTSGTYELVTSLTQLGDEATCIIVNSDNNMAMGLIANSNRNGVEVTPVENKIVPSDEIAIINIKKVENGYTLYNTNGVTTGYVDSNTLGYLYAEYSTSNNQLRASVDKVTVAVLTMLNDNNVKIQFTAVKGQDQELRYLQYNNASNVKAFACYKDTQKDVKLYVNPTTVSRDRKLVTLAFDGEANAEMRVNKGDEVTIPALTISSDDESVVLANVQRFVKYSLEWDGGEVITGSEGVYTANTDIVGTATITASLSDLPDEPCPYVAENAYFTLDVVDSYTDIIDVSCFEGQGLDANTYGYATWTSPNSGVSFAFVTKYSSAAKTSFDLRVNGNYGLVVTANPNGKLLDRIIINYKDGQDATRGLEVFSSDAAYDYNTDKDFATGLGQSTGFKLMAADGEVSQVLNKTLEYWALGSINSNVSIQSIIFEYVDSPRYDGEFQQVKMAFSTDRMNLLQGANADEVTLSITNAVTGNEVSWNDFKPNAVISIEPADTEVLHFDNETGKVTVNTAATGRATLTVSPEEGSFLFKADAPAVFNLLVRSQAENDGSSDKPYTVAEYIRAYDCIPENEEVWVNGYVTGFMRTPGLPEFSLDGAYDTNFTLSEVPDDPRPYIAVDIPTGNARFRNELGISKSPENMGRHIMVIGKHGNFYGVAGLKEMTDYKWLDRQPEISLRNSVLNGGYYNALLHIPEDLREYTVTVVDANGNDATKLFDFSDDMRNVTPSADTFNNAYKLTINAPAQAHYDMSFVRTYEIRVVNPENIIDPNLYVRIPDFKTIVNADNTEYNFLFCFHNEFNDVAMGPQNISPAYRSDVMVNVREDQAIVPGTDVAVITIKFIAENEYQLLIKKSEDEIYYLSPGRTEDELNGNYLYSFTETELEGNLPTVSATVNDGQTVFCFNNTGNRTKELRYNRGVNSRFSCYGGSNDSDRETNAAPVILYAAATPVNVIWKYDDGTEAGKLLDEENAVQQYTADGHTYFLEVIPQEAAKLITLGLEGTLRVGTEAVEDTNFKLNTEGTDVDGTDVKDTYVKGTVIDAGVYTLIPETHFENTHYALMLDDNTIDVEVLPILLPITVTPGEAPVLAEWNADGVKTFTIGGGEGYEEALTVTLTEAELPDGFNVARDLKVEVRPQFVPLYAESPERGVDDLYYDPADEDVVFRVDGTAFNLTSIKFPCSGLYTIGLASTSNNFDLPANAGTLSAEIYPSLDGLVLSYESMGVESKYNPGEIRTFSPEGIQIKYAFEVSAEGTDWYHENGKNPYVEIAARGVDIWYKLHVDADAEDRTPEGMKPGRMAAANVADVADMGYSQISDAGNIYIGPFAYTSPNAEKDLSFVLKKNGAQTPMMASSSPDDPKSEQYVTLIKTLPDLTGVDAIEADDEEAVFYDLNGLRVNPEHRAPGIYIRVVNGHAEKILLR